MSRESDGSVATCVHDGELLALVIYRQFEPHKTTFLTPKECSQQLGFIVYTKGTRIPRHVHLPLERTITGTTEVIFVRAGVCTAEIYSDSKQLIAEFSLGAGDVILLNGGAHGFRVHEDTVLMEVKQGPFTDRPEKERF
jgi:hypothetical protein